MQITIFIIAIGNQEYKKYSIEILTHYFSKFNLIKLFFLEDELDINYKHAHPSWLKLISHKYTKDNNFTLCWDLDLLPKSQHTKFDFTMLNNNYLNMCYDTSVILGYPKFNSNFYYNGGLIGIPEKERNFVEEIYETFAPGTYPSYEQYYLNDHICLQKKYINILPSEYNTLFHNGPLFDKTSFCHYTWQCNDSSDRNFLIKNHYAKYIDTIDS